MTVPSIEARDLTKRFGSFTALDHLNLKVEGSKCVGFLGPNGAGKTTTLKMLTDMIFPSAGEAFINGHSVRQDRKRALGNCGVLIETPEIYPSLTPRQALEMVADLRGIAGREQKARIEEVLSEVKMLEWADAKTGKFSKGMKQRVNIAASLLSDPDVLLLDEPSTGLDPRGMAEVRAIIRGLKRNQRLIFMSSHILSEVNDVCDEVALVNRGKLLFYDSLTNVTAKFASSQSGVDVGFVDPVDDATVSGKIASLSGVTSIERLDARRLRIQFKGGLPVQASLLEQIAGMKLGLLRYQDAANALEEVYLREIERGD